MELITRWTLAAKAFEMVRSQDPNWASARPEGWRKKLEADLEALGPNPTPEQVDEIKTGLCSVHSCDVCDASDLAEVVKIEMSHEVKPTIYICAKCLMKAMLLIEP